MTTLTTEEIVDIAKQSGLGFLLEAGFMCHQEVKDFAKLVAERERKFYMQLFLDPENQPTQFGTAIEEYRDAEKADLLKRLEIAKKVWHEDQQRISEIAAKEREACAAICDEETNQQSIGGNSWWATTNCAEAIRARGNT